MTFVSNNAGQVIRWGSSPHLPRFNIACPLVMLPFTSSSVLRQTTLSDFDLQQTISNARRFIASGLSVSESVDAALRQDDTDAAQRNALISALELEQTERNSQGGAYTQVEKQTAADVTPGIGSVDDWQYRDIGQ